MVDSFATSSRSIASGLSLVSGSFSAEEGCTDTTAYWEKKFESLIPLKKGGAP